MVRVSEIDAARAQWELDKWFAPECCPVCDRFGKVQKIRFTESMATSLIWLLQKSNGDEWIHVPTKGNRQMVTSNNVSKLSLWGLSDRKPNIDDPKKKCVGFHRINLRGRQFLGGRVAIPEHIFTYDKERIPQHHLSDVVVRDIKIHQVDGNFDYQETLKVAGL